jgi:predicted nicotinamide N-methyase
MMMHPMRDSIRQEFSFGRYHISLVLPNPEAIRAEWESRQREEDAAGKEGNPGEAFPFWAKAWPSSRAICTFLSKQPGLFKEKRVLEIGAGLGLPSLLCALEATSVLCTDLSEEAMQFAQISAALNGMENIRCSVLDWTLNSQPLPCDLLLMSDLNYAPEAFPHLHRMLEQYRQSHATILLATPQRLSGRSFAESISPWVSESEEIIVAEGDTMVPVSIFLMKPGTW